MKGNKRKALIAGRHTGEDLHLWGHMAVRRALQEETFSPRFKGAPILCQFTSIGRGVIGTSTRPMLNLSLVLCASVCAFSLSHPGTSDLGSSACSE